MKQPASTNRLQHRRVLADGTTLEMELRVDDRDAPIRNGTVTLRHANGQVAMSGQYQVGRPAGVWRRFYADGSRLSRQTYVGGQPAGEFEQWYRSGARALVARFADGRLDGDCETFHADGRSELLRKYEKGRLVMARQITATGKEYVVDRIKGTWNGSPLPFVKFCQVTHTGAVFCLTAAQFRERIADLLTLEQLEDVIAGIRRAFEIAGLDGDHRGLFVSCSGGHLQVAAGKGPPVAPPGDSAITLPTESELGAMAEGCPAIAGVGQPAGTPAGDTSWQDTIDAAVDILDAAFDNCRDDMRGPVLAGGGHPLAHIGRGDDEQPDDEEPEAEPPAGKIDIGLPPVEEQSPGETIAIFLVAAVVEWVAKKIATAIVEALDPSRSGTMEEAEREFVIKETLSLLKDKIAEAVEGVPTGGQTWDAVGKLVNEHLGFCLPGANCTGEEAGTPAPASGGGGGGEGGTGGGTGTTGLVDPEAVTCTDIARAWSGTKDRCDEADWKTYECIQWLRFAHGCVDPALIDPGPFGDYTCEAADDRDLREVLCEARGMVAQPVEGGILCLPSADVSVLRYDLCSDPRVLVLDHQCLDRKLGRRRRELRSTPAPREAVSVVPANPPTAPRLRRVDAAGFEREVLGNPLPVLVVFTAETCGPCHRVARVLEEAAEDYGGRLEFRNVDVLQEPALARAHAITFTPTMVVFDRGVPVGTRRVGAAPADRILRFVDRTLARGGAEPRTRG